MTKPRVFIGSSVEGLNIAYAVQQNLLHNAEVTVWDQGIFELSKTTIESLSKTLQDCDFAVFVFSPDDLLTIRNTSHPTVRDNVLFEFGLFIGKLGRDRVYFLLPMKGELHLPSDLLGITPGKYEENRSDGSMQAATGAACNQIRIQMQSLGLMPGRSSTLVNIESSEPSINKAWYDDFIDKKYAEARQSLTKELPQKTGEDALIHKSWILMCDYHIGGESDISPICLFSEEHSDKPSIQVTIANILRYEHHVSTAMTILTKAQERFPKDAGIIRAIALCHGDHEDHESAIAELQKFGPAQFPDVAIDLSEVLERNSKITEALEVIQKCFANHPNHIALRFRYARLAQELNHHEMAVALLWKLSLDNPESISHLGYLGNSLLLLGLYDQAIQFYRKAERLMTPDDTSQWIVSNIGNLLSQKGLPSEAILSLENALKKEPMSEYAHDKMAYALKAKRAEEKLFEKALTLGKRKIREAESIILASSAIQHSGTSEPNLIINEQPHK